MNAIPVAVNSKGEQRAAEQRGGADESDARHGRALYHWQRRASRGFEALVLSDVVMGGDTSQTGAAMSRQRAWQAAAAAAAAADNT